MRLTEESMDRASALASIVLPTPGTSSMSRWPSASSTVSVVLTTSDLPSITFSMFAVTRSVTAARVSKLLICLPLCRRQCAEAGLPAVVAGPSGLRSWQLGDAQAMTCR